MKLNEEIEIARGFFPIVSDLCESLANGLDHIDGMHNKDLYQGLKLVAKIEPVKKDYELVGIKFTVSLINQEKIVVTSVSHMLNLKKLEISSFWTCFKYGNPLLDEKNRKLEGKVIDAMYWSKVSCKSYKQKTLQRVLNDWLPLVDYTIANYQDIVKRQYSMRYEKAILNYLNVSSLLSEVTR